MNEKMPLPGLKYCKHTVAHSSSSHLNISYHLMFFRQYRPEYNGRARVCAHKTAVYAFARDENKAEKSR